MLLTYLASTGCFSELVSTGHGLGAVPFESVLDASPAYPVVEYDSRVNHAIVETPVGPCFLTPAQLDSLRTFIKAPGPAARMISGVPKSSKTLTLHSTLPYMWRCAGPDTPTPVFLKITCTDTCSFDAQLNGAISKMAADFGMQEKILELMDTADRIVGLASAVAGCDAQLVILIDEFHQPFWYAFWEDKAAHTARLLLDKTRSLVSDFTLMEEIFSHPDYTPESGWPKLSAAMKDAATTLKTVFHRRAVKICLTSSATSSVSLTLARANANGFDIGGETMSINFGQTTHTEADYLEMAARAILAKRQIMQGHKYDPLEASELPALAKLNHYDAARLTDVTGALKASTALWPAGGAELEQIERERPPYWPPRLATSLAAFHRNQNPLDAVNAVVEAGKTEATSDLLLSVTCLGRAGRQLLAGVAYNPGYTWGEVEMQLLEVKTSLERGFPTAFTAMCMPRSRPGDSTELVQVLPPYPAVFAEIMTPRGTLKPLDAGYQAAVYRVFEVTKGIVEAKSLKKLLPYDVDELAGAGFQALVHCGFAVKTDTGFRAPETTAEFCQMDFVKQIFKAHDMCPDCARPSVQCAGGACLVDRGTSSTKLAAATQQSARQTRVIDALGAICRDAHFGKVPDTAVNQLFIMLMMAIRHKDAHSSFTTVLAKADFPSSLLSRLAAAIKATPAFNNKCKSENK